MSAVSFATSVRGTPVLASRARRSDGARAPGLPASLPISSTRNGETIDATTRFASSFSPARPLTSSLPRIRDPSQPAAASSPAHPS